MHLSLWKDETSDRRSALMQRRLESLGGDDDGEGKKKIYPSKQQSL